MLENLRKKKGISQKELAKKAQISSNYLCELEDKNNIYKKTPSIEVITRLAKALEVSPLLICQYFIIRIDSIQKQKQKPKGGNTMRKVAIYSRKSVYIEGSMSVENQINFCKKYISERYNDVEYMIFEDEGYSGSNTNRPEFIRMMSYVKLNKIDMVICYKIDRIARNILDFFDIFRDLEKHNVKLVSITEGFDPTTSSGKMLMVMLAGFAEMERMNIQQRVRDNNLALAKRGSWTGGSSPIGYRQSLKTLEIENAEAIEEIFKMKASRKDLSKILDIINKKYPNFISSKNVLLQLLRKTIYVKSSESVSMYLAKKGYIVVGDADGVHSYLRYKDSETNNTYMCVATDIKGIVDEETWLQVQFIADENNTRQNSRFSKNYWLTKTLRCPICNQTYMGHTKKSGNKTYEYYMCRDNARGKYKTCTNTKRLHKNILENYVDEFLLELQNKDVFDSIFESCKDNSFDKDIKNLEKSIKKYDKQIVSMTEKITFASLEASKILMQQLDKLIKEKKDLEIRKNELELKSLEMKTTNNSKDHIYECLLEYHKNLPIESKRRIAISVFKYITYDPCTNKFEVEFN